MNCFEDKPIVLTGVDAELTPSSRGENIIAAMDVNVNDVDVITDKTR
jgi:hypothetical protein